MSASHLRALSTWLLARGALAVLFGAMAAVGFTEAVPQGSGQGSGVLAALALAGLAGGGVQILAGAQLKRRPALTGIALAGTALGLVQFPLGTAVSAWALLTQRGPVDTPDAPVEPRRWVWWLLLLSTLPVGATLLSAMAR